MNLQKILIVFGLTLAAGIIFHFGILRLFKPAWLKSQKAKAITGSVIMGLVAFSISFSYHPVQPIYAHEAIVNEAFFADSHYRIFYVIENSDRETAYKFYRGLMDECERRNLDKLETIRPVVHQSLSDFISPYILRISEEKLQEILRYYVMAISSMVFTDPNPLCDLYLGEFGGPPASFAWKDSRFQEFQQNFEDAIKSASQGGSKIDLPELQAALQDFENSFKKDFTNFPPTSTTADYMQDIQLATDMAHTYVGYYQSMQIPAGYIKPGDLYRITLLK